MNTFLAVLVLAFSFAAAPPQTQPAAPKSDAHHQGVAERGDKVMGFSHDKTAHHFRLYADGGAIEADAKDPKGTASRDAIRGHFTHITKMFTEGDFNAPMLIHQQNPPGTATMTRLKEQIRYTLEETPRGGRIRITTQNAETLHAVHQFLKFQIKDHQTGDPTAISKAP